MGADHPPTSAECVRWTSRPSLCTKTSRQ